MLLSNQLIRTLFGERAVTFRVEVNAMRAGNAAGGATIKRVEDGTGLGLSGSRLGFRGTEDLGGGLTAGFVLEGGFLADAGTLAQGGRAWGRQVYVSIANASVGELRMGRQYLVGDTVAAIGEQMDHTPDQHGNEHGMLDCGTDVRWTVRRRQQDEYDDHRERALQRS